jgi:hypothetical protein
MIIYIKQNEIVTEFYIDEPTHNRLIEEGFQEVEVADVEIPSDYTCEHFIKENGIWIYKPDNK